MRFGSDPDDANEFFAWEDANATDTYLERLPFGYQLSKQIFDLIHGTFTGFTNKLKGKVQVFWFGQLGIQSNKLFL